MQAWQIAWVGYALLHDVSNLWHTNGFYPQPYTLAYSDSNLGYALFGMIGSGPEAAVGRYNLIYIFAFALASIGAYALVRQLGAGRIAAAVAGATFAYAPWRYAHEGHLQILSTGGIALSLAMLARGHGWSLRDGYRPDRVRPGWALAGWAVAAWQLTLGFGIGVPFVYVLVFGALSAVVVWWRRGRPAISRRLLSFDLIGLGGLGAVAVAMAYPYLQVLTLHPDARRSWEYVALYSPPLSGFAVAPQSSLLWGELHEPARKMLGDSANEKELLCGLVLYGLATAGLFISVWTVRQRMLLLLGTVASVLLALGTNGPLYLFAYLLLPGIDGSRTPGRLVLWTTLLLAVLAAGFVTAVARYRMRRPIVLWVLLAAVLIEGLPNIDHPRVPAAPAAFAAASGPRVVLPSDPLTDQNVLLWSTAGFPTMLNGGSGFEPPDQQATRELLQHFPDEASVNKLRSLGVRSVVVVRDRAIGTPFEGALDAPVEGLGLTRQEVGPDVLYTIAATEPQPRW
ncbi:MAG TPA: hypothetical protein DGT23_11675 [Micromonosporaceae bacterium]|nr:hypothetical protein [Micromonosporaceae bacterium]